MTFSNKANPFEAELKSMPKNSKFGQYFPWDAAKQDFDTSGFDPQLCNHAVCDDDLRRVVAILKKSRYYNPDYIPITCWLIPVSIVLLITTISVLNQQSPLGNVHRRLILVCLVLLLLLPVGLLVLAKRSFIQRSPVRVEKLKQVLKQVQAQIFPNRNVDLRISNLGSFLIIDSSKTIWPSVASKNPSHRRMSAQIGQEDGPLVSLKDIA